MSRAGEYLRGGLPSVRIVYDSKEVTAHLFTRERGSSYRLGRTGERTPRLLAGDASRSLGGGDLSRGRGERVYESYASRRGDRALSPLKSSLLGEKFRRGGDLGRARQLSSRRGLRDLLLNAGERLRGRDERPPGVYVSAEARPRRGGEPRRGGGERPARYVSPRGGERGRGERGRYVFENLSSLFGALDAANTTRTASRSGPCFWRY